MKQLFVGFLLIVGTTVLTQDAKMIPEVSLPLMPKAPVIDGKINDAEWQYATRMEGFCKHGGPLFPAEATFRAGSDGKKLYIAVSSEVGPKGLLQKVVPNPATNAMAWLDDCIEIVVIPDLNKKKQKIFHSILTNRGAQYSRSKHGNTPAPWRGNWELKGQEKDGKWNIEMALPLEDVSMKPGKMPKNMGLRICRGWRNLTTGKLTSNWESVRAAYFSNFGIPKVNWDNDAPVVQVVQLKDSPKATMPKIKLRIFNPTDKQIEAKLNYLLKPKNSAGVSKDTKISIEPGETKVVDLPGREPVNNEPFDTLIEVTSINGKKTYYRRSFVWQSERPEKIFADKSGDAASSIFFQFAYFPSYHKMRLNLDLNAIDDTSKIERITVKILDQKGKEIAKTEMPPLKNKVSQMLWGIPDLKKVAEANGGSAEFTITLDLEGIKGGSVSKKFVRNVMPWEGTKLGKSEDIIVPPFTPIKVDGMNVSTVLRTHQLNKLGLWKQVTAAGQPLLKNDGMKLEAVVNGKQQAVIVDSFKFSEKKDYRVKTASVWQAGTLKGTSETIWDYDGMMKWILKISPCAETVDSLKLVIPLDDQKMPLFHTCTDGIRFNYGGAIPKGSGKVWNGTKAARNSIIGNYVPYIWSGDELRGVSVFGDNDKGWITSEKVPCQELIRKNGILYLVLNLISGAAEIKNPREILIGFLATPVKPMPKNWRNWNSWSWRGDGMIKFDRSFAFYGSCWSWGALTPCLDIYPVGKDSNFWKEMAKARKAGKADPEYIKKWMNVFLPFKGKGKYIPNEETMKKFTVHIKACFHVAVSRKGKEDLFYTNARGVRFDTPEGQTFVDEWYRMPFISRKFKKPQGRAYDLDPVESFRDYAMWWYKQMFESGACDHIYWDDVFMQSNFNLVGTEAYQRPDGSIQPASGIFSMRELVRRTAILQRELKRPSCNMVHMTNTATAPILAFAGMNYDWEDNVGHKDFQDRYDKEYIRTLSIGRQFGNYPTVLAPVKGTKEEMEWCIRTATGVMITHETRWSASHQAYWDSVKILYDFGYGKPDTQIFNYWDKDYPIKVLGSDSTSLVIKKPGETMVVVCDYGEGGNMKLIPDLNKLGLKSGFKAVNAETRKELKVENDQVPFTLKKHDFIIIILKNSE